ncbi:putative pectinesterase inhibitor domain-containing protein [Lupinus albus]|uniref:Putative pectinesterase inhibitor domain-containing protein n=1 Tax=Lupinus albus TaxID=3870 RepID=A0A6A4P0V4_LUPAL|nr:putative pectinesterase inhibitor domain-containing protein [Lupinus albus]
MNSSKVSFLFTLFMILIFSHSLIPASCQSLFESICKETLENEGACIQLMKSDPRIPSATNYVDLTNYILDMAIKKATEGQNYLLDLMKTNPSKAIHQCATIDYNGSISSFKTAKVDLTQDPPTASYDAKIAGDGPANCAEAIKAENINNPTIFDINKTMLLLSDIASFAANKVGRF